MNSRNRLHFECRSDPHSLFYSILSVWIAIQTIWKASVAARSIKEFPGDQVAFPSAEKGNMVRFDLANRRHAVDTCFHSRMYGRRCNLFVDDALTSKRIAYTYLFSNSNHLCLLLLFILFGMPGALMFKRINFDKFRICLPVRFNNLRCYPFHLLIKLNFQPQ